MDLCADISSCASSTSVLPLSDAALAGMFIQGDAEAFEIACTRYYPRLFRTALRIVRDTDDARDAVQDALLSAFKGMKSFQGASSVSTWMTRIVINACLIQLRKKRRRPLLSLDATHDDAACLADVLIDPSIDLLRDLLASEERELLKEAINRLRPDLKDAVQQYQVSGDRLAVVARRANVSLPAMKSRLYRAKRSLLEECRSRR